jgi:hypothetical protein
MSARRKPMSPTKIAEREAQRKYAAAMRERAEPGPNIEALDLPANGNIEARKIGRSTYAKRAAWYDRVLVKGSPGYRAYERLLDLHAVAMGEDGGADNVVGFVSAAGSHELTNDRRMRAGKEKAAVLDRVGAHNRRLLEMLIAPVETVPTWGAAVWLVFREKDAHATAALVRAAVSDLGLSFALFDSAPRGG